MIETDRLLLRLPEPRDAPAYAAMLGDAEVMRYIGTGETGSSADAAAQVERYAEAWRDDGFGKFSVVRRVDGAVIGRVGVLAWDPEGWRPGTRAEIGPRAEIELGWMLIRDAWGHGYATEAATAARDWALSEIDLRRLISLIHPENLRSQRVAETIGERRDSLIATHRGIECQLWALPPSA